MARNVQQKELAAMVGLSQQAITKIERLDQAHSGYTVQLSLALRCNPVWLATGVGSTGLDDELYEHSDAPAFSADVTLTSLAMTDEQRHLWVNIGKTIISHDHRTIEKAPKRPIPGNPAAI